MSPRMSVVSVYLLACALCTQLAPAQQASELRLEASQYRQLLVLLEEDLDSKPASEYADRVSRIKEGFQRASDLLENLTAAVGRRWRFGDVSILVSARLGRALADVALPVTQRQWQRRDMADFIVASDIDTVNEGAVTMETGCGKPGKHVLLSASSFGDNFNDTIHRKIALFFSQYRWGLLSEEPLAGNLFQTGARREYRPASCSLQLRVHARIGDTDRPCAYDPATRSLSPQCSLRVNESQPADGETASFLFAPYSRLVTRFCDSHSADPRVRHNRAADNLLNRQCSDLGAAQIIRMHGDYWSTPAGATPAPGPVAFQVVTEAERRRVVVVMDVSGSMAAESRITKMTSAVGQFLTDDLEDGSECGLISFNLIARVLQPLVTIDSVAVRRQLAGVVSSLTANGGTCIGGAVIAAMQLLGMDASSPSKRMTGQIILLSDGQEGCEQQLDTAVALVERTSIEVVAFRYGDLADARMRQLAEKSGGRQFFGETTSTDISGLRLSLGETTSGSARAERTLTLTTEEIDQTFRQRVFHVDASVGRDLAFTLSFPTAPGSVSSLRLLVRSPSGKEFGFGNSSDIYKVDTKMGTIVVHIPDAEIQPGQWTMINLAISGRRKRQAAGGAREGAGEATGQVIVTGRSPKGSTEAPVTLSAEVSPDTVDLVSEDTRIGVYARLLKGYSAVTGATVFATVRSNAGEVARVNLTDAGVGADLKANDGTYSGHLPAESLNEARDFSVSVTSLAPVSRVVSAGKVTVKRQNVGFRRQLVPPARVTDLRVNVSIASGEALLVWTAVEDPGQPGASSSYSIRCSTLREDLLRNFSNCEELTVVEAGPASAGSRQVANVFRHISGRGPMLIALAALSAFNVTGPASNLVSLDPTAPSFEASLERLGVLHLAQDQGKKESGEGEGEGALLELTVGLITGTVGGCLILAVALLLVYFRRGQSMRGRGSRTPPGRTRSESDPSAQPLAAAPV